MPAAPAAPAAPASTTPPPAAATTPPPASSADKAPQDYLGDIVGELQDMDSGSPPPPEPKPSAKPATKPAAKSAVEPPEPKPGDKPEEPELAEVDEPEAPETPPDEPEEPPKPVKAAELRAAYDGLKKKVREEMEPEIQKLRAKIKEIEAKPPEETAAVVEKLKAVETENADLREKLARAEYEESPDYAEKYDKPYREMWDRATTAFSQLTIREQDGVDDSGEPNFVTRRATEADLIRLGALDLSELDKAAQEMFGPSAPRAIQYIEKLRELAEAKHTAKVQAKAKAIEWKKEQTVKSQEQLAARAKAWAEVNGALLEKFPRAFQANETDAEDKASHAKGFALADLMFGTLRPDQVEALPESFRNTIKAGKELSVEQQVKLHALARLKMANHDRLVAARKKDKVRIAELEKSLAEYEASEPRAGRTRSGAKSVDRPWEEAVADELKALDK